MRRILCGWHLKQSEGGSGLLGHAEADDAWMLKANVFQDAMKVEKPMSSYGSLFELIFCAVSGNFEDGQTNGIKRLHIG